ncbi:MAG: hypothetical protein KUG73_15315, partial [Pseudomonadales bacterium]|nr:hypothetical protein [Pseudomonadales bacterium]
MRRVRVYQTFIFSILLSFLAGCGGVTEKGDPITAESPIIDSSIYLQSNDADDNQETFSIEGPTSNQLNSGTFKTLCLLYTSDAADEAR